MGTQFSLPYQVSQGYECVAWLAIFLLKPSGKPACWISSSAFQYELVGLLKQLSEGTPAVLCTSQVLDLSSGFITMKIRAYMSNFQGLTPPFALLEKPLRLAKPGREWASLMPASPWEAGWPCCSRHVSEMTDDGIGARVTRPQCVGDWEMRKPQRTAGDSFCRNLWGAACNSLLCLLRR